MPAVSTRTRTHVFATGVTRMPRSCGANLWGGRSVGKELGCVVKEGKRRGLSAGPRGIRQSVVVNVLFSKTRYTCIFDSRQLGP